MPALHSELLNNGASYFTHRWFLLLSLVSALAFGFCVYHVFFHPLSHIPGPLIAKVTGHWRNYHLMSGRWHEQILEIHRVYGPIVRIAPNELSIVDENASKRLYGHGHNGDKTDWYTTWELPQTAPALFAAQDRKLHSFLRKRVSSAYSMTAILGFERYIQSCLDLLLYKLKEHADQGHSVDMTAWTNAFAFDVVGELAYGESLGHLETETDVMGVQEAIHLGFWASSITGHFPGQSQLYFNNPVSRKILRFFGQKDMFADFQRWSTTRVQGRMDSKEPSKRADMLSHFMKMRKADGAPAEFGEVLIEAMNIIGAGADTTSIGMRACLYYICKHPDVYRKLQQAIDDYYDHHNLEEPIKYSQTQEIPYLVAVVREATRLFPSITWQLLRHAPPGLVVDGKAIPPHTRVGVSPLAQNRDKNIWGDDADVFDPERWLESTERTNYLNSANMTFGGSGPRTCIGRNIALVEMHKFISQLLYHFDIEFVDPDKPWQITTFWFSFQREMKMHLKVRDGRVPRAP